MYMTLHNFCYKCTQHAHVVYLCICGIVFICFESWVDKITRLCIYSVLSHINERLCLKYIINRLCLFFIASGGVHRGNPLAKEWMASGHYSRLDQELKPILAKVENQQQEYSSKYATNFFNEVSTNTHTKMNVFVWDFSSIRCIVYQFALLKI